MSRVDVEMRSKQTICLKLRGQTESTLEVVVVVNKRRRTRSRTQLQTVADAFMVDEGVDEEKLLSGPGQRFMSSASTEDLNHWSQGQPGSSNESGCFGTST